MKVHEAVERDLSEMGDVAESALAATALALAAEIDAGKNSATSKSMCAKALADVLRELRSLAPPKKERDDLSDLRARRDKRRSSGSAAAKTSART